MSINDFLYNNLNKYITAKYILNHYFLSMISFFHFQTNLHLVAYNVTGWSHSVVIPLSPKYNFEINNVKSKLSYLRKFTR